MGMIYTNKSRISLSLTESLERSTEVDETKVMDEVIVVTLVEGGPGGATVLEVQGFNPISTNSMPVMRRTRTVRR